MAVVYASVQVLHKDSQPLSLSIHIEWVLMNQIDYMKHLSISNPIYSGSN